MAVDPTEHLGTLEREIVQRVNAAGDEAALEAERVAVLGKKGVVSELMKTLGTMPTETRILMGPALNGLKDRVGTAISARRDMLKEEALARAIVADAVDVTLPVRPSPLETAASIRSVR